MPTESAQSVGEGKKNSKLLLCARLYKREGHFIKASEETCKKSIALTSLSTYKETGWEAKYPAKAHSWKVETQDFNPYSSCAEQTQVKDKELCWESWSKPTQEQHTTLQSMRTKEKRKVTYPGYLCECKSASWTACIHGSVWRFPQKGLVELFYYKQHSKQSLYNSDSWS